MDVEVLGREKLTRTQNAVSIVPPEGYLYPASNVAPIELPEVAERALMTTSD